MLILPTSRIGAFISVIVQSLAAIILASSEHINLRTWFWANLRLQKQPINFFGNWHSLATTWAIPVQTIATDMPEDFSRTTRTVHN